MKNITHVIKADKVNMGGIILDQALPIRDIEQVDPFLLIHHWQDTFNGGQRQQDIGVGPHPHRGFAPVTFVYKGAVHHRDSAGHESIVSAGGTQWMNSGRGIIHSERPSKEIATDGGAYEIIQIWINAPSSRKLDDPEYIALDAEDTPVLRGNDNLSAVHVVAGSYHGLQSKVSTYSDMLILNLQFEPGGKQTIDVPVGYNTLMYILDGAVTVNGDTTVSGKHVVVYGDDGTSVNIKATASSRILFLAGAPINEPLATYGPFVMNSQEELMAAINDYNAGKMGELTEVFE